MGFDPFTSILNSISGNKKVNDLRPEARRRTKEQGKFTDSVGRTSLLAGGGGITDEDISSIDVSKIKDNRMFANNERVDSLLGGKNVDQFIKAWRGYVTQRTGDIQKANLRPGRKQTFLGGGV